MQRFSWKYTLPVLAAGCMLYSLSSRGTGLAAGLPAPPAGRVTEGTLLALDSENRPAGVCPLRRTRVKAEISGFLSRTTVTQEFENPLSGAIEAVYTFPLPQNAAVDDMTLHIGDRTVLARIKPREEARRIYEQARSKGHLAGLLDQERPNIFTQSVANIPPGAKVNITISYVETLKYEDGSYEYVFPMVVGPRYMPGGFGGSRSVPDASRIAPTVTPPGIRAGHDIFVEVALDAGVPVAGLSAAEHEIVVDRVSSRQAVVRLREQNSIPNKDFVLRYGVQGSKIEDGVFFHRGVQGGFFTLILQPPERTASADITPKELVFVLDTSGSMHGFPIEKAKETMKLALEGLNPRDTFNLITFSGDTHILFPEPVPATADNLRKAQEFLASRRGMGGTGMMKAVRAALEPSGRSGHIRVVCFMTDGYVGNDMEILAEVQKYSGARVFSFGIGNSVNRFLLDRMAEYGRGEVEYVTLNSDGSAAARRLHERLRNPLLTDIALDWGSLPVTDVYPTRIPDLFSAKPVVIIGRYEGPRKGVLHLRGKVAGRPFIREIAVDMPGAEPRHDVLGKLWARKKIEDLMAQDWAGVQRGTPRADVKEAVTRLGLDFRLMTAFTSFVAVEESIVTEGGEPRRIEVPVEMPEGVSYEGVFGEADQLRGAAFRSGSAGIAGRALLTASSIRREAATDRAPRKAVSASPSVVPLPAMPGSEVKDRAADSKLAPALLEILQSTNASKPLGPSLQAYVRDGKVGVQVMLSDASPGVIEKLKQVGLEIVYHPKGMKMLNGRIAVSALKKLAALASVASIRPVRT